MSVMNFSATAQRALDETWSRLIQGGKRDGWPEFQNGTMHRAMIETWSRLVHDGKSDAWLEFYDGAIPKSADDPVTTQRLLVRLPIKPRTMAGETANLTTSGHTTWARMIGANDARLPISQPARKTARVSCHSIQQTSERAGLSRFPAWRSSARKAAQDDDGVRREVSVLTR